MCYPSQWRKATLATPQLGATLSLATSASHHARRRAWAASTRYFLQFVGAYLCRSVTTPDVTAAGCQTVEPALLHELDLAFFEDRFEGATPTEQRVLEAMARESGQIRLTRLRPHVGDVPSVDLVVRRLVERGLIHRAAPGTYDLFAPGGRAG
jgi:hypothetical protein